MHGYFDDKDPEPERPRRDTELTLGAGALLGLFFGLVLVCGLCFGVGYAVGHHSSAPSAAANPPTSAPDQEPLEGSNAIPKPSADAPSAVPASPAGDPSTTPDAGVNPANEQPGPAAGGQTPDGQSGPGQGATPWTAPGPASGPAPSVVQPVRPVWPSAGNTAPTTQGGPVPQGGPVHGPAAPHVHAALPAPAYLVVQIAAVANPEDAYVLVAALRRRGYPVAATREPADGLIHVLIGPFYNRDEANRWRDRLLSDGYNAVVQP